MTDKKEESLEQRLENMQLEEIFIELNGVTDRLEDRDVSLDESFALYERGMKMLKACNEKLDTVEKKMLKIDGNGELDEF